MLWLFIRKDHHEWLYQSIAQLIVLLLVIWLLWDRQKRIWCLVDTLNCLRVNWLVSYCFRVATFFEFEFSFFVIWGLIISIFIWTHRLFFQAFTLRIRLLKQSSTFIQNLLWCCFRINTTFLGDIHLFIVRLANSFHRFRFRIMHLNFTYLI